MSTERCNPELSNDSLIEHLHRYILASKLCMGKTVLDLACGEGYGSCLLAMLAKKVIGMDIDKTTIMRAAEKYEFPNLSFMYGDCTSIPQDAHQFDLVVSFETLEHHDQHEKMLEEITRVLKPGGMLIISTPDKDEYSIKPNKKNPFHVKELTKPEFLTLLEDHFIHVALYGQRLLYGSSIVHERGGPWHSYSAPHALPKYLLALCSDAKLPLLASSFYEGDVWHSEPVKRLAYQLSTSPVRQLIDGLRRWVKG
jgi:SAM-dependent methyltransferase